MAIEKNALIGRLVAGRYRVASHLGTGAMATIYRAHDEEEDREIALKIVKPEIVRNKTAAARFHREAKAASKLRHDGIVAVTAWGFDDELPYIAMELVEGEDLFELLDRRGALDEEQALHVAIALCGALYAAHQQGVVHRDLKPENIMVGGVDDPKVPVHIKVLDFGIAKLLGPRSGDLWGDETVPQALTKVGSAVGTPSHMAPEQARGDEVDGRTDIYAVGVLLYEMVTGHLPFEGDNPLHVAIRQVRDPPPPPTRHKPELHPELEAIILRMLEKDPADRYQTVAELERALTHVLTDIDPDHQTAQRAIPSEAEDDVKTVQRDVPPELDDEDYEQLTAQREIPASLRNMIARSAHRPALAPVIQDDASLTGVTTSYEDPTTMELDTVAGKTMRRAVRDRLNAAIAAADAADVGESSGEVTASKPTIVDEASNDPTPFVGSRDIPRPEPKTLVDGDGSAAVASGNIGVESPAEGSGVQAHDIDDEDSEGAIATVVADPNNLSGDAARMVLEARAIAEAAISAEVKRAAATSVTKQSDFGALSSTGGGPAAVDVIAAGSGAHPHTVSQMEGAASVDALSQSGTSLPRAHAPTVDLPGGVWSAAPNTRGAANELEDLLKQMPRQRQPIVGSVVVLIFLGLAIVALVYLLVGVATF